MNVSKKETLYVAHTHLNYQLAKTYLPSLSVISILTVLSALGTVMLGVVLEILNSKAWGPSTSLSSMIVILIHDTSITDELGENESSGMVS